jgi:hypothetical protein
MNNDVIKIVPPAPAILDLEPGQLVERAFKIAVELATVIRAGQMYCNINGEEFVKVDGWIAMGCLLGLNPFVVDVRSLPDGGFEAIVEIRSRGGHVYAAASAICGMDEKRWAAAPAFSRRSMAITRAIGKAYRISFSWVMRLAGMSATPAEDMPQFTPEKPREREEPPAAERRANGEIFDPFAKTWSKKTEPKKSKPGDWNGQWPK